MMLMASMLMRYDSEISVKGEGNVQDNEREHGSPLMNVRVVLSSLLLISN